jgi:cytochrome c-type biogenesis protein CcmE
VAGRRSPVRLIIALSVAGALAIFLVYTALAGGTPSIQPSQLSSQHGRVSLAGKVVGPPSGTALGPSGLHFTLRDVQGTTTVPVVYRGSVPDLFRTGRDVSVEGSLQDGVFVADKLVTKCPSKYTNKAS